LIGNYGGMEIIITESQLNNILKTQNIIRNLFEKGYTVDDIGKYTSLNKGLIYDAIKDYDYEIDCDSAYHILIDLFNLSQLSSKYNDGVRHISLDLDNMSGTLYFEYRNEKCLLTGMATPYWDNDCILPIDGLSCEFFNSENQSTNYFDSEVSYKTFSIPTHFNSISEFIDWFNNNYFITLIPLFEKLIIFYEKKI
jgi:hypothetical protein